MINNWFIGFICGLSLFFLTGALLKLHNRYNEEYLIKQEFENLYQTSQSKDFRLFRTTQTLTDMVDREIVILDTGTVQSIIVRRGINFLRVFISTIGI